MASFSCTVPNLNISIEVAEPKPGDNDGTLRGKNSEKIIL